MSEKQTKAAEMIVRLRYCAGANFGGCEKCPYQDGVDCSGTLMLDAADALAALLEKEAQT